MWTSGVKIAAGTDAPEPFVVPGFSIHEELELLARAGLPTSEVLRIATQGSAELVGASETMGTIAVGKRADFLLLNANPLEDIRNTRRIDTVVAGGEFLSPVSLQTLLQRSLPESDLRSQDTISLNQAD
jgi:imidazolonepropionase-like amidohydrolase